jgi:2-polyprenyl-3-methyl-5-hydroxy-6-metoxy-1,4-benzoquinol methylase
MSTESEPPRASLMRAGLVRMIREVLRSTKQMPPGVRLHVLGRFLTCPFGRALARLPRGVRLLDIGGGHGLFGVLAMEAGARSVVSVEPDRSKMAHALRHPGLHVVCGYDQAIGGTFDVVTLFDVLYRVPREEWDALFLRLRARVAPGGLLVIKDLDPTSRLKFAWNRVQETISDNLLHLTLGTAFSYEPPDQVMARLRRAGFRDVRAERIDAGYPHSHIAYVARP